MYSLKRLLKYLYFIWSNVFVRFFLFLNGVSIESKATLLVKVRLSISKKNYINLKNSFFRKSKLDIVGTENTLIVNKSEIFCTSISITGNKNIVELEEGVKLRNSVIIVRGTNCFVKIGSETTFGGIRIVNVGRNNDVLIGKNCLFSDHIELWASDTHSIYNSNGEFINNEKPVIIGDEVWVGSHVKILKGVNIGSGAIIGMNSMVTKDLFPNSLNVGSPAYSINQDVTWSLKYENE